mgnify:CR=1 FL=1
MNLGVKIHGCPKIIRFTLVYPGVSTGRVSFQWWERPCSPCAETPETASAAWRWQGATAVVAVLKSFQRQSQIGAVPWSSIRHLMIFFIDVLFCQVQQVQWISELQIGAPDFNGCYMSRSPLQSFLEVQESWFQVRPCHDQRSTFYWNILFWSSSISLTSAEGTLLGHPWANVKNERNVSTHWIITCQIQQCEYWSILCIEGCQFGCQQCSGNAPVDLVREGARRNSWTCWWTKPLGCTSGPQALQWPKDVNLYNMMKLLALVGMKTWKGRGVR